MTCSANVVLPTWRGPASTWMNRRGSRTRAKAVANISRWNSVLAISVSLLNILSNFTQCADHRDGASNPRVPGDYEHALKGVDELIRLTRENPDGGDSPYGAPLARPT